MLVTAQLLLPLLLVDRRCKGKQAIAARRKKEAGERQGQEQGKQSSGAHLEGRTLYWSLLVPSWLNTMPCLQWQHPHVKINRNCKELRTLQSCAAGAHSYKLGWQQHQAAPVHSCTHQTKLLLPTFKKQEESKGAAPVGVVDVDLVALHRGVPPDALANAGLEALQVAEHAACEQTHSSVEARIPAKLRFHRRVQLAQHCVMDVIDQQFTSSSMVWYISAVLLCRDVRHGQGDTAAETSEQSSWRTVDGVLHLGLGKGVGVGDAILAAGAAKLRAAGRSVR
jgi:hypothetical protein